MMPAGEAPPRVPIPKNGVDYRSKVVLAPMVRSGELPSRLMALKYGADLVWGASLTPFPALIAGCAEPSVTWDEPGPETIDRAIIGTTRRVNPHTSTIEFSRLPSSAKRHPGDADSAPRESVIYRIHPVLEHKRLIYQVGTANPELAVQAARIVAADVAGIDVNAGCPKPFSTSGGMGAALLRTPDLLCSILRRLVVEVGSEFDIGISVKIRLLEEAEETEALVRKLVTTGITGLTVHCRTPPMRPRERAIRGQLCMVGRVCREAGVACVMNGDVASRSEAQQLMEEFNVDGAMIATAAEKNPSCFRSTEDSGLLLERGTWRQLVAEYVRFALDVENRWGNTKYLLGQMIPGKEPCYPRMNRAKNYRELVRVLDMENVEGLAELAAQVDLRSGLFDRVPRAEKRARAREERKAEEKSIADSEANERRAKRIKKAAHEVRETPDTGSALGAGAAQAPLSV